MEFDLWREPDAKPVFTFMLRPRLIQEGVGCKLICCVSGKPPPKVEKQHLLSLFCNIKNNYLIRYNGLKIVHNWVITIHIISHHMLMVYALWRLQHVKQEIVHCIVVML
jgi:hypothetical protein